MVNSSLSFYLFSSQREFSNRKKSGVREEVSDVNKLLRNNILLVSSRLCTSTLVCEPTQLTLFTSPTTPPTPPHVRGRQFTTLEIWQSPDKFTGKRKNQRSCLHLHQVAVPISMDRLAPPYLVDGLFYYKEDENTSGTSNTDLKPRQAAAPATPTATTATSPSPSQSKFLLRTGGLRRPPHIPPSGAMRRTTSSTPTSLSR